MPAARACERTSIIAETITAGRSSHGGTERFIALQLMLGRRFEKDETVNVAGIAIGIQANVEAADRVTEPLQYSEMRLPPPTSTSSCARTFLLLAPACVACSIGLVSRRLRTGRPR